MTETVNETLQLISSANLPDLKISEGGRVRTIKPDDQKLFLFHAIANPTSLNVRKFCDATGLNERFFNRVSSAIADAGFLKVEKSGQLKLTILTAAIERIA